LKYCIRCGRGNTESHYDERPKSEFHRLVNLMDNYLKKFQINMYVRNMENGKLDHTDEINELKQSPYYDANFDFERNPLV
jgi:hypothetical protein